MTDSSLVVEAPLFYATKYFETTAGDAFDPATITAATLVTTSSISLSGRACGIWMTASDVTGASDYLSASVQVSPDNTVWFTEFAEFNIDNQTLQREITSNTARYARLVVRNVGAMDATIFALAAGSERTAN